MSLTMPELNEGSDLSRILSVSNPGGGEQVHSVPSLADATFTWDYAKGARPGLDKLYEKAKRAQWNATTDLPWDTDVDQEKLAVASLEQFGHTVDASDRSRGGARRSGSASRRNPRTGR